VITVTLFILTLMGFGVAMTIQAYKLAEERDQKTAELETQEQISGFLVDIFQTSDPNQSAGDKITAREILDQGAARIDSLAAEPAIQAKLLDSLGQVYRNLGVFDQSEKILTQALEARIREFGEESLEVASILHARGDLRYYSGDYDRAQELYRRALAIHRQLLGDRSGGAAHSLHSLAMVVNDIGESEEAEKLYREALEIHREVSGDETEDVADDLNNLAGVLSVAAANWTRPSPCSGRPWPFDARSSATRISTWRTASTTSQP
jgi:tetratricopeptide (TPR) repeat protein